METAIDTEIGDLLRHWRGLRRKSQLDVALDTGISQKHLSFIESGRSTPGRQVLLCIAEALEVPLRERNTLLLAAGYAPRYAYEELEESAAAAAAAMPSSPILKAMQRMLRQHDPYPALAMDRHWNVLHSNDAAPRLFGRFTDLSAHPKPRNLLRLIFDPRGLRPFIANWEQLAPSLIQRVHRESVARVIDPATRQLLEELLAYPDVLPEWRYPSRFAPECDPAQAVIPISFDLAGQRLDYFSLVTTLGTPQTASGQELRIESMFPADEQSEQLHAALMAGANAKA